MKPKAKLWIIPLVTLASIAGLVAIKKPIVRSSPHQLEQKTPTPNETKAEDTEEEIPVDKDASNGS